MNSDQNRLRGKTGIAAWWLIAIGVATTILGIALIFLNPSSGYSDSPISAPVAYMIFILSLSLPGVLNIIAGIMLFKRKPRARTLSVALLSVESISRLQPSLQPLPKALPSHSPLSSRWFCTSLPCCF